MGLDGGYQIKDARQGVVHIDGRPERRVKGLGRRLQFFVKEKGARIKDGRGMIARKGFGARLPQATGVVAQPGQVKSDHAFLCYMKTRIESRHVNLDVSQAPIKFSPHRYCIVCVPGSSEFTAFHPPASPKGTGWKAQVEQPISKMPARARTSLQSDKDISYSQSSNWQLLAGSRPTQRPSGQRIFSCGHCSLRSI